ncbi:hypothetical protein MUGA111182_07015 [Mucilaginibacter galii]|uniref:Uncharacterized protein n=1 Tax=Mucilaginibacter galii TaxID=2005073 RepID=A0A917JBK5_9SPHI|nr:hypothetical protein [Mucilaginibacter galii]GGI51597.1 hypothetical protein GCM10011425_28090 [Mucilaginibacter galii]
MQPFPQDYKRWLIDALIVPLEGAEQHCYYDKKHNRFIALTTDVFLTFDAVLVYRVSTTYSKKELSAYKDLIERLRSKDGTIIPINKLSLDVRKQVQHKFLEMLGKIKEQAGIYRAVKAQDETSTLVLDNLTEHSKDYAQIHNWWWMKFRGELLDGFAERFLESHNIDLRTVYVWHADEYVSRLTVKVLEQPKKKPWWQVW